MVGTPVACVAYDVCMCALHKYKEPKETKKENKSKTKAMYKWINENIKLEKFIGKN